MLSPSSCAAGTAPSRESSDELGSYAQLYGGIEERLTAAEDLRANGAGVHAIWRFVEDSAGALQSSVRRERAFIRMWWTVQGAIAVGLILSLVLSAVLVTNDAITIGTAFLLFQYVLLVSRPLEELVHELETVQKANGAMLRVAELLAIEPTVVDRGTVSPSPGALADRPRVDVTFAYDGHDGDDEIILRDVNLEIVRRPVGRRRRPDRQRQDHVLATAAAPRRGDERRRSSSAGCRSPRSR